MFKCIEVKDPEMIKEIYRFRYHIACEEDDIFDKSRFPDGLETDEYDKYSIQYIVLDDKKKIAACLRLIHDSDIGYPVLNSLKVDPDEESKLSSYKKCGEISRIFINKNYRGMKSTGLIMDLFIKKVGKRMDDMGLVFTYGALEESFLRLLNIMKMPYKKIGPFQLYGNRLRAPCIMFTDELLELNKELFFESVQ